MVTDFAAWDPENKARMIQECLEKIERLEGIVASRDAEIATLKEEKQVLHNEVRRMYLKSDSGYPWKEGKK